MPVLLDVVVMDRHVSKSQESWKVDVSTIQYLLFGVPVTPHYLQLGDGDGVFRREALRHALGTLRVLFRPLQ